MSSGKISISKFWPSTIEDKKIFIFSIVSIVVEPICSTNFVTPKFANCVKKDNLLKAINNFEIELDLIKKAIYDNSEDMLKQYFIKSTKRREKLNK